MSQNILNYIKTLSNNKIIQELLIKSIGNILSKQENLELFIQMNNDKISHIKDWFQSSLENNEKWINIKNSNNIPTKLERLFTIDALNNAADKYFEKQNNKLKKIELDENHEKLIIDLGDYYIVQMLTPEALDNESKVMQHCVGHGGYDERLEIEEYQYLSLRDKFNKAHVTIEICENKILQFRGKQNKVPDNKYLEILIPWLLKDKNYDENFLFKFGLYLDNNIVKSIDSIDLIENVDYVLQKNDGINFETSLSKKYIFKRAYEFQKPYSALVMNFNFTTAISNFKLDKLLYVYTDLNEKYSLIFDIDKDNKIINHFENLGILFEEKNKHDNFLNTKELFLKNSLNILVKEKYKNIPYEKFNCFLNETNNKVYHLNEISLVSDNSVITAKMFLFHNNIKKINIPNITIDGNLSIKNIVSIHFTDYLTINGDFLYSNYNNIHLGDVIFPKEMFISGNFISEYLRQIPNNLNVSGNLELKHSKIKKLPENIKIGKNLNLNHSSIEELPDNLTIYGDLILSECVKLKKLPKKLIIHGDLYLDKTSGILELPDDLSVLGSIYLNNSNITKLPDNFVVNGMLKLSNCLRLTNLPNNLKVLGCLYLNNSNVKIIPKDLQIGKDLYLEKTEIEELPDNFVIKRGTLSLKNCKKIKKLPNGLHIGGDLILNNNINMLPSDLTVKGNIIGGEKINKEILKTKFK